MIHIFLSQLFYITIFTNKKTEMVKNILNKNTPISISPILHK